MVYVAFFAVQCLFNFDITSNANARIFLEKANQQSSAKDNHLSLSKSTGHSSSKITVRLNKRFQPKSIIACDVFAAEPLVHYVAVPKPVYGYNVFIPSPLPLCYSLRGPPHVV